MKHTRHMKTCLHCKQSLPLSRFGFSNMSSDGYCSKCKDCVMLYKRKPGPVPRFNKDNNKPTPDQLAYHPVQKPGLTKQQRQIMSGSTTKDAKFVRNHDVAPPVTFRESAGTYWMCKPAYVRETGNHLIPSRGAI